MKLPVVIKLFVLFIFEWPFYTEFTIHNEKQDIHHRCVAHLRMAVYSSSYESLMIGSFNNRNLHGKV